MQAQTTRVVFKSLSFGIIRGFLRVYSSIGFGLGDCVIEIFGSGFSGCRFKEFGAS